MSTITMVEVKYVGRKPFAIDNVSGSGKLWSGNGDVQLVSVRCARVLVKYPDQWALANAEDDQLLTVPEIVQARGEDGEMVQINVEDLDRPIERMTKVELVALALRKWGKELNVDQPKKVLMDTVEQLKRDHGESV